MLHNPTKLRKDTKIPGVSKEMEGININMIIDDIPN